LSASSQIQFPQQGVRVRRSVLPQSPQQGSPESRVFMSKLILPRRIEIASSMNAPLLREKRASVSSMLV